MKTWLETKVLITGGQSGLGAAFAKRLRGLGAEVYTTSRQEASLADQRLQWDMTNPESSKALLTTIKDNQLSFDTFIHCAHIFSERKMILQVKPTDFAQSLTQNTVPLYELCRGLVKDMYRKKFGKVLFIGSLISQYGGEGKISYITEKAALQGMMLGFHAEFSPSQVHVNIAHPNIFETADIHKRIPAEILQAMKAARSNGELLQLDEVLEACLKLIHPASIISGQSVLIDGGVKW